MPASKIDVLSRLSPLQWRGLEVPCQANSLSFAHHQVSHEQWGVDGAHVEHTGREPAHFSFRIPFRAGIAYYDNLYPQIFRSFWDYCLDGSSGPLFHPEFGEIQAKVVSFKLIADPTIRDGYDVDVEWIETIEETSINQSSYAPIATAIALAGNLDEISGNIEPPIIYDDGSGDSLKDAAKKIEGAIFLAQMTMEDLAAQVENVLSSVNSMIDVASTNANPAVWPVVDSLKEIDSQLRQLKNSFSPTKKKTAMGMVETETTTALLAAQSAMGVDDFLKINPRLGAKKKVMTGTEYFFYVMA